MRDADYTHPASGRVYREGDPAHRFARLAACLAAECEAFLYHYKQQLEGRDYLSQHRAWPSDPDRVARAMGRAIAEIDKAYTDIVVDEHLHEYGLGKQDEEWRRKYGAVER